MPRPVVGWTRVKWHSTKIRHSACFVDYWCDIVLPLSDSVGNEATGKAVGMSWIVSNTVPSVVVASGSRSMNMRCAMVEISCIRHSIDIRDPMKTNTNVLCHVWRHKEARTPCLVCFVVVTFSKTVSDPHVLWGQTLISSGRAARSRLITSLLLLLLLLLFTSSIFRHHGCRRKS